MFAYLSSFYEVSVCPRNAPRPICHWLLLFGSSNRCLEVWAVLCPGKWEICAGFLPFFLSRSAHLHVVSDENVTRWKSIKDGKCIWSENERSPDLHWEKWKVKFLNIAIGVTNFKGFTKVLMKARVWAWLLLLVCNYMEGSCFGPGSAKIENYTSNRA